MIKIRKSKDRGYFNHGWLETYHTFSFADYYDANFKGFKTLRVINEDIVAPEMGFGTHAHRDMNILTCIISGTLEHKDSMGNGSKIHPLEWQFMSAGTGVEHSEYNPSKDTPVHLLQIWIRPSAHDLPPRYTQLEKIEDKGSYWRTVATPEGGEGKIRLDQNAFVHHVKMGQGESKTVNVKKDMGVWIQMIQGSLDVNSQTLQAGDGAAIEDEQNLNLAAKEKNSEFVLFEL